MNTNIFLFLLNFIFILTNADIEVPEFIYVAEEQFVSTFVQSKILNVNLNSYLEISVKDSSSCEIDVPKEMLNSDFIEVEGCLSNLCQSVKVFGDKTLLSQFLNLITLRKYGNFNVCQFNFQLKDYEIHLVTMKPIGSEDSLLTFQSDENYYIENPKEVSKLEYKPIIRINQLSNADTVYMSISFDYSCGPLSKILFTGSSNVFSYFEVEQNSYIQGQPLSFNKIKVELKTNLNDFNEFFLKKLSFELDKECAVDFYVSMSGFGVRESNLDTVQVEIIKQNENASNNKDGLSVGGIIGLSFIPVGIIFCFYYAIMRDEKYNKDLSLINHYHNGNNDVGSYTATTRPPNNYQHRVKISDSDNVPIAIPVSSNNAYEEDYNSTL